ncbi:MAG: hypothetical protein AAGF91_12510 [Actinomycetota bacterium]
MRRALLVVTALTLAACGSDDEASETTDAPAETDAPADTETPPDTEAPADTEPPDTEPPSATAPPETDAPADTEPPATDAPPPTEVISEPALAAFTPVGQGPYAVGVATITVTDDTRERALPVDVWFPLADVPGDDTPRHRYTFVSGDYYESPRAFSADAGAASDDGPFPLVVYSHGSGAVRYVHSDYTETIASHGHLVVAAEHLGNTAIERVTGVEIDGNQVSIDRPLDVQLLITALTDASHPTAGVYAGLVDADRVAVTGHSAGGYTTYAAVSGVDTEFGTVPADDRIDAIIPLAPAVGSGGPDNTRLTDERLASIEIPALVMVGSDDVTTPVDPNVTRAWEVTQSVPHYRAELVAAEHQSFTDACDYLEALPTNDPPPTELVAQVVEALAAEGCSPDDMPIERVKEITNTLAIAFLDSVFRDGEMITPDNTAIPDDFVYLVKS